MQMKTINELRSLPTFEERYAYLRLAGIVGDTRFGFNRYLNQKFYRSQEWKRVRDQVILRDNGCDLAIAGREIFDKVMVHHMNPMDADSLVNFDSTILDPRFLITVSEQTHNAIHYGSIENLKGDPIHRRPGDTILW